MALSNFTYQEPIIDDPGYIDDATMESLCAAILTEQLSSDELGQFVVTNEAFDVVTEKTIVKLDKKAKLSRAYKVAILKCAAQKNDRDYKKLRKLWILEAKLFKKLEAKYGNKAKAMSRQAVAKLGRSKSKTANTASVRAERAPSAKNLGGTSKFPATSH